VSGFPCSPLLSAESAVVGRDHAECHGGTLVCAVRSSHTTFCPIVLRSSRLYSIVPGSRSPTSSKVPTGRSISTLLLHHSFLHVTSPLAILQLKKKVNASDNKLLNVAYHREHPFPSRVSFLSKFLAKISRHFTTVSPLLGFVRTFQFGFILAIIGIGEALFGRYSLQIGHLL
jgi:hypothetical protein